MSLCVLDQFEGTKLLLYSYLMLKGYFKGCNAMRGKRGSENM